MSSARHAPRRAVRLLHQAAVVAAATAIALGAAAPAQAGGDPLAGHTITGRLVQAYPESREEDTLAEEPLSWVQPAGGSPVRVDTDDVHGLPAGATVAVTVGGTVDDDATDTVGTAHAVTDSVVLGPPAAVPVTPGPAADVTDRVTVVLVEAGGGRPDSTTLPELTTALDSTVHDFWRDQTGGRVRLGVAATHGWVATTAGCGTPTAMWDQAAAAAGFTPGPGNHLLVYVSAGSASIADCSYGLAEVGSGLGSGGRLYVQDTLPTLMAHELGHNFGLGHSSERQCDDTVDTGACRTEGYRDYYDVMGASWEHVGTLNAAQEARLGVLPAAQQRTVDAAGPGATVTLAPLSGQTGVRALHLTAPDGTDYWVEYRPASGQDDWLDTPADRLGLQSGVLLHRSGQLPDTSLLLDGTPSAAAGWDGDLQTALPVGATVALADGFTVTVDGIGAGGATVAVTTSPGAPGGTPAAPPSGSTGTLPGSGCGATASCGGDAPSADGGATASPSPDGGLNYSIALPGRPAGHTAAAPGRIALAALWSPTAWTALAAVLLGVAMLGWLLARRLGGRSRGRS